MIEPDLSAQLLLNLPILVVGIAFMLGSILGSFLNVVVYRLPIMLQREWEAEARTILEPKLVQLLALLPTEFAARARQLLGAKDESLSAEEPFNLLLPNSHCPNCGYEIKPWENIPVLSYILLGGKCANCSQRIALRYPLVELFTGLISCIVVYHFAPGWTGLLALAFTWTLIALSLIDYDHKLLPDSMTLGLLWLGLISNSFAVFTDFVSAFWGAVAGWLLLWVVYWAFKLITGKEGMGQGDFKLLAALGAWLGWQSLPMIIILSSLAGSALGGVLLLTGRDRNNPIPFGPYLAIAGFLALLWGDQIMQWYNDLFLSGVYA